MGRKKIYTETTLRKAVRKYFDSISREVEITERVPTGQKDKMGHEIYRVDPVYNKLGEVAKMTEYLVPPTIGGLCLYLKIYGSTWKRWHDRDKYPEFQEIIEEAEDTIETWKKEQVIVRKNTRGLIWDLEVNHGCGKQSKNPDDEGGQKHGVVVLPAINELTPPDDEDDSHG